MFWAQIFVLPKKVVKTIEATCRSFLWTGGIELSKRALIAWNIICQPEVAGGLNILDIVDWNKAAITKLLWNISQKKDKLWVKWIHCYYGTSRNFLTDIPKQSSWIVQRILKASKYVEKAGYSMNDLRGMNQFSIKQFYLKIRGGFHKVDWRKLVCNNLAAPRWIFILRLAAFSKLCTRDRLAAWGMEIDPTCPLCEADVESHSHLFFSCLVSTQIWQNILKWLGINRIPRNWEWELSWACMHAKGRSANAEIYRLSLAVTIYHIWRERNMRAFQLKKQPLEGIIRMIIQEVHMRGSSQVKIAKWLDMHNYYPS